MFRTSIETSDIVDANETLAEIFGYSSIEEFKQFTANDFYQNEEQRKAFLEVIQKDGFVIEYHMLLNRKDGTEIWVSLSGSIFRKEGFIEGIMIDISEQKKAEEALRESEEKYRTLFSEVPIGILTCDKNGVIQSVNKAALQILGSPSEAATKGINLLTFPLLVDAGVSSDLKICLEKGDPIKSEKEYKTKWGKEITIHYKGIPIKDKDGNVIGALSTFEDVSERKLAEKMLIDSERKYRLLAENVTDVIFTLDLDWKITYVSPSVEFLIGFKDEEVLPKTLDEILETSSFDVALKILAEELIIEDSDDKDLLRSIITELEFKCKDGSNVWTEAKVTFLRDKDEKAIGVLGVLRDISQRKEMKV
jgi:PAS domain S-box-containing protein